MEEELKAYNKGVQTGIKHSVPSPLTNKLFGKMDEQLTDLKIAVQGSEKDINFIKEELSRTAKRNIDEHNAIKDTLEKYLDKIDKDCAAKWTENALKWVAFIIVGAVITAVINLVVMP